MSVTTVTLRRAHVSSVVSVVTVAEDFGVRVLPVILPIGVVSLHTQYRQLWAKACRSEDVNAPQLEVESGNDITGTVLSSSPLRRASCLRVVEELSYSTLLRY